MATVCPFRVMVRKGSQSFDRSGLIFQLHLEQVFHLGQVVSPLRALVPVYKWEEPERSRGVTAWNGGVR